jgi:hypothetical protein
MTTKTRNPRRPGRYDGAAERLDRHDQQASLEARRARRAARRERRTTYAEHFAATPAKFRPVLDYILRRSNSERDVVELVAAVPRVGFVYVAVAEIDNADSSKRPWLWVDRFAVVLGCLPADRRAKLYRAVLRAGLAHDSVDVRTWAAKMLPVHVDDPRQLVRLLMPVVRHDAGEPRWQAALTLARIAPNADVVTALAEAVGAHWIAHRRAHWERGATGREEAADALAAIGPAAAAALPALRAAILRRDENVAFGDARYAIATAIAKIGGVRVLSPR